MNQVVELGFTFFRIIVLAFVLSVMVFSDKLSKSPIIVYFTFGVATLLGNTFYRFVHMLLITESPFFSAAEISSIGGILLFGASAHVAFRDREISKKKTIIICCIAYFLFSCAIWTLDNRIIIKNIFSAIALDYLACESLFALKCSKAFNKKEFSLLGVAAIGVAVVKLLEIMMGKMPVVEIIIGALSCIMTLYFLFRLFKDRKGKFSILFSLANVGGCWCLVTRYFCSGTIRMIIDTFGIIMIFIMSVIQYRGKENDLF